MLFFIWIYYFYFLFLQKIKKKNYVKKIIKNAKNYADRHELAEMKLRGLANLYYYYSRIYNAEITSYEHGAKDTLELVKKYIYSNINFNNAEEIMFAIEKYINE